MRDWGDAVGNFNTSDQHWLPPDANVDVAADVAAALDKFVEASGAPDKVRVDMEPATLDHVIN